MKKLLGVLFCFAFLLMSGVAFSQSVEAPKSDIEYNSCFVCEAFSVSQDVAKGVNISQTIFRQGSYAYYINKLQADSQKVITKTNEALFNRYSLVPQCPVIYLGKRGTKYKNLYRFSNPRLYNQPPNFNI